MVEYGALVLQAFKEAGANFGNLLGEIATSVGDAIGGILRSVGLGG